MSQGHDISASPSNPEAKATKKRRFYGLSAQVRRVIDPESYAEFYNSSPTDGNSIDTGELFSDEAVKDYADIVSGFANDSTQLSLTFDGISTPIPSPAIRAKLHAIAETLNLEHESIGTGDERFLILSKRTPKKSDIDGTYSLYEYLFCDTYIGLRGSYVNRVAEHYGQHLHQSVKQKRAERDGHEGRHHITVANTKALQALAPELTVELVFGRLQEVPDNWKPVGLGSVANESGNRAFFVVLSWPAMTQKLAELGILDQHFHITLGFQQEDIHNLPKDESSLVAGHLITQLKSVEAHPSPVKGAPKKKGESKKTASPAKKALPNQAEQAETSTPNPWSILMSMRAAGEEPSNVLPELDELRSQGRKIVARLKAMKQGAPRHPMSAFMAYLQERRGPFRAQNPDMSMIDVLKHMATNWKELTEDEKRPFEELAEKDKLRYAEEMKAYEEKHKNAETLPETLASDQKLGQTAKAEEEEDDDSESSSQSDSDSDTELDVRRGFGKKKGAHTPTIPAAAPKKPRSAYMIYVTATREEARAQNPDMSFADLSKWVGSRWLGMAQEEKQKYLSMAAEEKAAYELATTQIATSTNANSSTQTIVLTAKKGAQQAHSSNDGDDSDNSASSGSQSAPSTSLRGKFKRPADMPKLPLNAFLIFARNKRGEVKVQHPDKGILEISMVLSERWNSMTDDEKSPYHLEAEQEWQKYEAEMNRLGYPVEKR